MTRSKQNDQHVYIKKKELATITQRPQQQRYSITALKHLTWIT